MKDQHAELTWREGRVPVSLRFDDPYYSLENGLAETRHVFLGGNGLPDRLRDGFHVAELGFGTGLNYLALAQMWAAQGQPGRLCFTSFEAFPMTAPDMARALEQFPEVGDLAQDLLAQWGGDRIEVAGVALTLITGDARQTLPGWSGHADAWFLDGFAPARNPELWEPALLAEVARHTAPGGTAATYSAAGDVRRALQAAGFTVARVPGYGRKRHMVEATLP